MFGVQNRERPVERSAPAPAHAREHDDLLLGHMRGEPSVDPFDQRREALGPAWVFGMPGFKALGRPRQFRHNPSVRRMKSRKDEIDQRAGREAQRYDRDEPRFNGRGNGHAENDGDDGEREPRQAFGRGDRPRRSNGFEEKAADQPVRALEGEPGTEAEAMPPKRGRGRPRKERPAEEASTDAAAIEADRLPPSLNGGDAATEEKPRRRRGRPPASETANAAN